MISDLTKHGINLGKNKLQLASIRVSGESYTDSILNLRTNVNHPDAHMMPFLTGSQEEREEKRCAREEELYCRQHIQCAVCGKVTRVKPWIFNNTCSYCSHDVNRYTTERDWDSFNEMPERTQVIMDRINRSY